MMLLGFLYQFTNQSFQRIELRAKSNVYFQQVRSAFKQEQEAVCRWTIYRKLAKDEEVFPIK